MCFLFKETEYSSGSLFLYLLSHNMAFSIQFQTLNEKLEDENRKVSFTIFINNRLDLY